MCEGDRNTRAGRRMACVECARNYMSLSVHVSACLSMYYVRSCVSVSTAKQCLFGERKGCHKKGWVLGVIWSAFHTGSLFANYLDTSYTNELECTPEWSRGGLT